MSHVMCHMTHVIYIYGFFFLQSSGASRWRVVEGLLSTGPTFSIFKMLNVIVEECFVNVLSS